MTMFLKLRALFLSSLLVFSLLATPVFDGSRIIAQVPDGQDEVVRSDTGLVVSSTSLASDVGAEILHQGGNSVDAAVATAFALAVTWPGAGNIGGGGFMIVRKANGETVTIDYREKAPLGSTPEMYLNKTGEIDRGLTA